MSTAPSPDFTTPRPPRLHLLNTDTLESLAASLAECATAVRTGSTLRGMSPAVVLDTLSELLREAAHVA